MQICLIEQKHLIYIDTLRFAKKTDLTSLKSKVDKLGIDKLKTVSVDLSQLSNVVEKLSNSNTVYDDSVNKVNAIHATDASEVVKKLTKM